MLDNARAEAGPGLRPRLSPAVGPGVGRAWRRTPAGPLVGGHRGAAGHAPENTLAAFRAAIDAGADYVELDVRLASDGVLVVIHDDDLGRTTDARGPVAARTSGELGELDAGRWFGSAWAGEPVPTLARVLDLLATSHRQAAVGTGALVEAKGPGAGAALGHALMAARAVWPLAICSFSPDELLAARAAAPSIATMLIVDRDRPRDDPLALARACGASMVNVPAAWLDTADVERLHGAGLLVAGGTCDDEATMRRAVRIGLDAIDSNVPGSAVRWRDACGDRPA